VQHSKQLEDWEGLDTHMTSAMSEMMEAQSQAERAVIERDGFAAALSELRCGLEAAGLDHRLYCSPAAAEMVVEVLRASVPARAQAELFSSAVAGLPVTIGSPRRHLSPSPTVSRVPSPTLQGSHPALVSRSPQQAAALPLGSRGNEGHLDNQAKSEGFEEGVHTTLKPVDPAVGLTCVESPVATTTMPATTPSDSQPPKRCAILLMRGGFPLSCARVLVRKQIPLAAEEGAWQDF
jgi:hypothetical protein